IARAFAELTDPRRPQARHHQLLDILAIAFCACLCGAERGVDRAELATAQEEVRREFLDRANGPPSPDTFRRVVRLLAPKAFRACLASDLEQFSAVGKGHVAIDGTAPPGRPRRGGRRSAAALGQRLCFANPADPGTVGERGPK
ncbi:MAG: transposase family protein, partial [Bryobacteraceae bacterium]